MISKWDLCMKNILVNLACVFFCLTAYASDWHDYWIEAVQLCNDKNYNEAIAMFDQAIACMEANGDVDHPHVYVDRGRLNLLLNRNELALADLNKALSNEKISKPERTRALVSRLMVNSRLGHDQYVLSDLKTFGETYENKPVREETKENIIIRNVPQCNCYRNIMTCYFIHSGMCESKNDIKILDSNIWIIKKACDCGCNECEEKNQTDRVCDACGAIIYSQNNQQKIEECKGWCDRMAIASSAWCGKVFKDIRCQAACAIAVYELQQGCYWCCNGEGFYKKCIKPFENICQYIKEPCDPAWD